MYYTISVFSIHTSDLLNYHAIEMSTTEMEYSIMSRMPNTVLTKARGDGEYVQFIKLRKEVYQNLSAI